MPAGAVVVLVLCNVVWALNVVISKVAVDDLGMPPLAYAFARSLVVMLVLLPLLRPVPRGLGRVLLVGLAISGGSFALLFMGLESASPAATGVVSLSGAPLTVLFAIVFLGEQVGWKRGLGIALTFAGVMVSVMAEGALEMGTGLLLVFASAVVGALGSVFVKRLDISSVRLQAWAAVSSSVVLLPLTLAGESGQVAALTDAPLALAGCLAFAGLVVSVGAHTAYYKMLQQYDANVVVPLTLLNPLFTVALGAWLTGDPVGYRLVLGGGIAMAGVAIILLRPSETFTKRFLVRSRI